MAAPTARRVVLVAVAVATLMLAHAATAIVLQPAASQGAQPLETSGLVGGFATYFRSATCPDGWSELPEAQGRIIVSVTDASTSGLTLGTPLGDKEDRMHTHPCVARAGRTPTRPRPHLTFAMSWLQGHRHHDTAREARCSRWLLQRPGCRAWDVHGDRHVGHRHVGPAVQPGRAVPPGGYQHQLRRAVWHGRLL